MSGDYSLAVVNRSVAQSLLRRGLDVWIASLHEEFAAVVSDPHVQSMGLSTRVIDLNDYDPSAQFDLHLWNDWPVNLTRRGAVFGAVCWAWEETVVPPSLTLPFSQELDFVAAASSFVADALLRGGATLPVFVVGEGVDHLHETAVNRTLDDGFGGPFNFLHVSSCLWRKGVDVLLRAFEEEFASEPRALLTIKTTRNPHNAYLDDLMARLPTSIRNRVTVRYDSLSPADLASLISSADCMVLPTRGEGFLLPAAEAMQLGTPVVVTRFSGHLDYCTDANALLVDYEMTASRSHVAVEGARVAEPSIGSLRHQMRRIFSSPSDFVQSLVAEGRKTASLLTWESTVDALLDGIEQGSGANSDTQGGRSVVLVSTWQQECGIATYTQNLLSSDHIRSRVSSILAEHIVRSRPLATFNEENIRVVPAWWRTNDGIANLCERIAHCDEEIVLVQQHSGLFSTVDLSAIVRSAHYSGKRVVIEFHNFSDDLIRDFPELVLVDLALVHREQDLSAVLMAGAPEAAVLPHGTASVLVPQAAPSLLDDDAKSPLVGVFGFCVPHKNFESALMAVAVLRSIGMDCKIRLLTAVSGTRESIEYKQRLSRFIRIFGLTDHAEVCHDFLPLDEVKSRLSQCDVAVFPYAPVAESASGAVRLGIESGIPVVVSDTAIFSEFGDAVRRVSFDDSLGLASAIRVLTGSDHIRADALRKQSKFLHATSFSRTGHLLDRLLSRLAVKEA